MKSRGIALLMVLLVLFLATIAATGLATQLDRTSRLVTVALHQQQALIYATSGTRWAAQVLAADAKAGEVDHLDEAWANSAEFSVEGGTVTLALADLQGRLNLNSLIAAPPNAPGTVTGPAPVDAAQAAALARLLALLELPPELLNAILDWLDADDVERFPGGAESRFYAQQSPPTRAANRPFQTLGELRQVAGLTAAHVRRLQPFVTVLPQPTPVNVNTAPPLLLQAIFNRSEREANAMIQQRPFRQVADLTREWPLPTESGGAATETAPSMLAVNSRHFELRTTATLGAGEVTLTTALQRRAPDGGVVTLWRRWGIR